LHLDNLLSKKASVKEKVYVEEEKWYIVEEINPENA
jgi:hypothetical protein